jgi:hypothetical protein
MHRFRALCHPSQITVTDVALNTSMTTVFGYDENPLTATNGTSELVNTGTNRGNLTTIKRQNGSSSLVQTYQYYDTGLPQMFTDVNNAQTRYTYGECNNSFPTQTAQTLSLTWGQHWDCTGGVMLSSTDANGQTAQTFYTDPSFWRPTSGTDATGAHTTVAYAPFQAGTQFAASESAMNFNETTSSADARTTFDTAGRTWLVQKRQSQTSSSYDSVQITYDAYGRPFQTTVPYVGTSGQAAPANTPVTQTTYDALGRIRLQQLADNARVFAILNGRDGFEDHFAGLRPQFGLAANLAGHGKKQQIGRTDAVNCGHESDRNSPPYFLHLIEVFHNLDEP